MRIYRHLTANAMYLEPFPFKRELAMEAYLSENEGVLALDDDVLSDVELIDSELSIKDGRSRKDTDGRIDLLVTYSQEYIGVVELKHGQLTLSSLTQLEDYLNESSRKDLVRRYGEAIGDSLSANPQWIGILVGLAIDSELAAKLQAGYVYGSVPIAALTIQRFRGSDGSVFVTTDLHFRRVGSPKDYTKYVFDHQTLHKNRLVLEVVKHYVQTHPSVTFAQLEQVFPKALQGFYGVFMTADNANAIYTEKGFKRHFLKSEDLVQLRDSVIAVCNQWGVGNIGAFVKHATHTLSYVIKRAHG
ncbi:MAG: hypothetical protein GXY83_36875 [Rhodopirellula sp.]|nr:hypothetical protein [Rhodopirellula sp.]